MNHERTHGFPKGADRLLQGQCDLALRNAGNPELAGRILVVWNARLKTTAGIACYRRRTIYLNPKLKEFGEIEVSRTLLHELAHFLASHRAGRKRIAPHGEEWKKACADLGIPGENRCHSLPFPRKKKSPKFFYRCPCCGNILRRVQPLSSPAACLPCCKKFNKGKYDKRFRFTAFEPGIAVQSFFSFFRRAG